MALYNPHSPHIIGPEWVPIREVDYRGSRYDSPQEIGYTFSLNAPIRASKAFFYIKEPPPDFVLFQPYTIGIYPAGTEADTGPIQRLVANVSDSSSLTNSGSVGIFNGARLINGMTVASCLVDPSNDAFISVVTGDDASWDLRVRFNMSPYSAILANKRILAVNVLYAMNWFAAGLTGNQTYHNYRFYLANNAFLTGATTNAYQYPVAQLDQWIPYTVNRVPLGDTNAGYNVTNYTDVQNVAPWTGSELQRFGSTGTDQICLQMKEFIHYSLGEGSIENVQLTYMALEIIYCEEQRTAFGTYLVGPWFSNHYTVPPATSGRNVHDLWWLYNANTVILRSPGTTGSTNPILPAGDYTMTVMQSNVGTTNISPPFIIPPPNLQTARQLYEIPGLQGIQIDHPIPVDNRVVGKTFTKSVTDILPQLSLWTSGSGVGSLVTNAHAYGRQTQGQVWGAITCSTGINNPGGTAYTYARFYARRFGTTSAPLSLFTPALSGGVPLTGASIGVSEFDALPEIADGWKQVDLEFLVPIQPTFGNSTFVWTATGENAGSRWEVLGASSLALSGVPPLWYTGYPTQVPNGATYGGTTSFETWMPGYILPSAAAQADQSSDAILMLAQALPAVSGVSLTQLTQPMSGIGLTCGIAPPGIPTSLTYNQLNWLQSNNINFDDFHRTPVASGWGGQWSVFAGSSSIYSTNGTNATFLASNSLNDLIRTGTTYTEVDMTAEMSIETSNDQVSPGIFYLTDANNYYGAFMLFSEGEDPDFDNGTAELGITVRVGGISTNVSVLLLHLRLHDRFNIRFQVQGGMLRAKGWLVGDSEPDIWNIYTADTRLTTGRAAVGSIAVGTAPSVVNVYDFLAVPFPLLGSTYQIERMDTVDDDWQVIMKATDLSLHSFNDYEARVGILTSYRMRMVDAYGFGGIYTSTLTSTIAAPGVAGTTVGTGSHIMTFTSNERQDGSINLAYSNAWTDDVNEGFNFPEAGFVQLQAMYGKNFYTVFRPLERGGEVFSRNLLVQAAAISPPTLADFRSLRDMAWDDVSYVCVRDEGGNRWFASVNVPSGSVTHLRQLYIVAINITEVTDTPSQVDP